VPSDLPLYAAAQAAAQLDRHSLDESCPSAVIPEVVRWDIECPGYGCNG